MLRVSRKAEQEFLEIVALEMHVAWQCGLAHPGPC